MKAITLASLLVLMANVLLFLWACICFASPASGDIVIGMATIAFIMLYNWSL